MSGIRCFLLTPAPMSARSISVFQWDRVCGAQPHGAHCCARRALEDVPLGPDETPTTVSLEDPSLDALWPTSCDHCGLAFDPQTADRGSGAQQKYRRSDTGEIIRLADAPAGAMWYADWMLTEGLNHWRGPDGRCLVVRTPGGEWMVDGRASNCTRKDDDVHRCWIRHGEAPNITVDKNGDTCAAGAGSILCGGYHGFLRNGELVPC